MKVYISSKSPTTVNDQVTTYAAFLIILLFGIFVVSGDAFGQQPFDSIVTKTESARDQIITIGQAVTGLMAAVLLVLAMGGRVAWKWVICVVAAGAGLTGLDAIQTWINA